MVPVAAANTVIDRLFDRYPYSSESTNGSTENSNSDTIAYLQEREYSEAFGVYYGTVLLYFMIRIILNIFYSKGILYGEV